MQSQDLSAPAASSADELQEDAARAHAKADDANLRSRLTPVVSLKGHRERTMSGVKFPDRRMSAMRTDGRSSRYIEKESIKFLGVPESALLLIGLLRSSE